MSSQSPTPTIEEQLENTLRQHQHDGTRPIRDVIWCICGHQMPRYGNSVNGNMAKHQAEVVSLLITKARIEAEYTGKRKMLRRIVVKGYLDDVTAVAYLTLCDAERNKALKATTEKG